MAEQIEANVLFEDYVYHSFLYYECDQPRISDSTFDSLCRQLLTMWPEVTHPDKKLADENALQAGTGHQIAGRWPAWVKQRAKAEGVDHWSLENVPVLPPYTVLSARCYSGVGSRETPDPVLSLMRRTGKALCDLGYRGRSGCAPGADTAFWQGAQESARYDEVGFDNFLPNAWMFKKPEFGGIVPDPSRNIYDATTFHDTYERAKELAFAARGSFEGLGKGGIELHCRNAYQVLGPTLDVPSRAVLCWAQPVGRQGKVRGGTNTAVQIALSRGIEVINLYKDDALRRIEAFLHDHETV